MRKASIAILMVALFCLMMAGVAYAATGITGTVKDISTGAAISGASVTDGTNTVYTDSNGNYTLNESSSGNFTLYASANGYLKTSLQAIVTSGAMTTVNWSLTKSYGNQPIPAKNMAFTILAWNDLGMHCDQDDYSYFCVLPPYNTLHAQVFRNGDQTAGVTVKYAFAKKTNSTLHTNFWTYASSFGWNLAPNVGLTGNGLSGTMKLDANGKGFTADGIPITPYDDDGTWDPYGTATLTVTDSLGNTQTANVVAPVSTEMMCSNCHGSSTVNPQAAILQSHDRLNGTTLYNDYLAGKPDLCAKCHASNALGAPGQTGVEPLSYAMHNYHASKVTNDTNGCYNCHPGPKTQCLRGIMERAGKGCVDCHGSCANVASSQGPGGVGGRQAWLQEPRCGQCHDSKHQENANTLYRNSIMQNSISPDMNGNIYCEACHNGTHGEYTTANPADASITQQFQGDNYWIWNCQVCHTNETFTGNTFHQ